MLTGVMHKIQTVFGYQDPYRSPDWMDTLTEMSELDALTEIKNQLAKVEFKAHAKLEKKIDYVLEIDRKTYQKVKKITYNYLTSLKINRESENNIHTAVYEYQRQLYVNYAQFFDYYLDQVALKLSDEKINSILARLLNAAFIMAKWRYFDDQPVPPGTWSNVHKVIKYAENLAIVNTTLFLYDFQLKETSIATLLKRGFMMDTLQKGNFSRLQIQLTEQVLKIWSSNPLIVNKYKQDRYQFFIMLENDRGPERLRALEKFAECRYWKTTRLIDLIEAYLCAVDTQKPLEGFGLTKLASVSVMVRLFKKIRKEWCVEGYTRQRRREARNKSHKLLNVSHGLNDICNRLNVLQGKKALRKSADDSFIFELKMAMHNRGQLEKARPHSAVGIENWWLVDESNSGFAVDLGKELSEWVRADILIGYTTPESKDLFSIAEIKSVKKQADGTYRAGLEHISQHALSLLVSRVEVGLDAVTGYHVVDDETNLTRISTFSCLYIKNESGNSQGANTLIMPRDEYKRGSYYQLNVDGEDRILSVGRIVSSQRDWIRAEIPT